MYVYTAPGSWNGGKRLVEFVSGDPLRLPLYSRDKGWVYDYGCDKETTRLN